jgi:hypothetical protein
MNIGCYPVDRLFLAAQPKVWAMTRQKLMGSERRGAGGGYIWQGGISSDWQQLGQPVDDLVSRSSKAVPPPARLKFTDLLFAALRIYEKSGVGVGRPPKQIANQPQRAAQHDTRRAVPDFSTAGGGGFSRGGAWRAGGAIIGPVGHFGLQLAAFFSPLQIIGHVFGKKFLHVRQNKSE